MSLCCSSRATDRASRQHLSRASLTSAQHAHSVEPRNSTHRLAGSLTPVPCGAGRLETDPPPFGGRHSSGIHEPTATLTSGISSRTRWLYRWCALCARGHGISGCLDEKGAPSLKVSPCMRPVSSPNHSMLCSPARCHACRGLPKLRAIFFLRAKNFWHAFSHP